MEVSLDRPPASLPPRVPNWVILVVIWAVGFALATVSDVLLAWGGELAFVALEITALTVISVGLLLVRSGRGRVLINRYWSGQAYPQEDPGDDARLADQREVEARRLFQRGTISRGDYERSIARRQFVHGELTRREYHARLEVIARDEAMLHLPQAHLVKPVRPPELGP